MLFMLFSQERNLKSMLTGILKFSDLRILKLFLLTTTILLPGLKWESIGYLEAFKKFITVSLSLPLEMRTSTWSFSSTKVL